MPDGPLYPSPLELGRQRLLDRELGGWSQTPGVGVDWNPLPPAPTLEERPQRLSDIFLEGAQRGSMGATVGGAGTRALPEYGNWVEEFESRPLVFRGLPGDQGRPVKDPLGMAPGKTAAFGSVNPLVAASYAGASPGSDLYPLRLNVAPGNLSEYPWREIPTHAPGQVFPTIPNADAAMKTPEWFKATYGDLGPRESLVATGVIDPGQHFGLNTTYPSLPARYHGRRGPGRLAGSVTGLSKADEYAWGAGKGMASLAGEPMVYGGVPVGMFGQPMRNPRAQTTIDAADQLVEAADRRLFESGRDPAGWYASEMADRDLTGWPSQNFEPPPPGVETTPFPVQGPEDYIAPATAAQNKQQRARFRHRYEVLKRMGMTHREIMDTEEVRARRVFEEVARDPQFKPSFKEKAGGFLKGGGLKRIGKGLLNPWGIIRDATIGAGVGGLSSLAGYAAGQPDIQHGFTPPPSIQEELQGPRQPDPYTREVPTGPYSEDEIRRATRDATVRKQDPNFLTRMELIDRIDEANRQFGEGTIPHDATLEELERMFPDVMRDWVWEE